MNINKSKVTLAAKIKSSGFEWPQFGKWATQDKDGEIFISGGDFTPVRMSGEVNWEFDAPYKSAGKVEVGLNWFQCILSRAEYFHLYPAPDADGWIEWKGGECPVDGDCGVSIRVRGDGGSARGKARHWSWGHSGCGSDIIAYRLHKPEQSIASKDIKVTPHGDSTIIIGGDPLTAMRRMQDSLVFDDSLAAKEEPVAVEFCESVMRSIPDPEKIKELAAVMGCSEDIEAMISVAKSNEDWIRSLTSRASSQAGSIEQLAADYRNKLDYANRKQDEADKANMESDAALSELEAAIAAIGFAITPLVDVKQEPELVIADWRDLWVGDVIELTGSANPCWKEHSGSEMTVKEVYRDQGDNDDQVDLLGESGGWSLGGNTTWRFIRRP